MKAAKKQNNTNTTNTKKSQVNEKSLGPGIDKFFKSAPKTFVFENVAVTNSKDGAKEIFANILKEKLRNVYDKESLAVDELCQEEDGACAVVIEGRNTVDTVECTGCIGKVTEIDEWKKLYELEVEKRKQLKKVYMNLAIRFSEIELKYTALLKNATANAYHQSADEAVNSTDDVFTAKEVKFLQCMPLDKKNDCSFILHCLKYAYKDPSVLALKTLKGTAAWLEIKSDGEQVQHEEKAPLTPKKVDRMRGLFMERISQCEIHSVEYGERIKDSYVNKMFAAGIRNLSKKFK